MEQEFITNAKDLRKKITGCSKIGFYSKKLANAELKRFQETIKTGVVPVRSYECEICGAWIILVERIKNLNKNNMEKLETTAEFVLELHKIVGSKGQVMIMNEFPELFEVKLEVGRWYKNQNALCFYASEDYQYGMHGGSGGWCDKCYWMTNICSNSKQWTIATKEEVETMLWKEAEKRGLGHDTEIEECLMYGKDSEWNSDSYDPHLSSDTDALFNKNGCIYKQGKWATPLDQNKEIKESIQRLEKELAELKSKVK